ncbi:MAG: DMT family transporter [Vicinamibacterales bacterium]
MSRPRIPIDAMLLLMAFIWGSNYSIVKSAFDDVPAHPFNAARLAIASVIFLALIILARRVRVPSVFYTPAPITRADWLRLVGLGVVGHFLYQIFFIGGLARTSVANSSLLLAATPVAIAVASAALGREAIGRWHWIGGAISLAGIYLVVGRGAGLSSDTLTGDLMVVGAVACWTVYTLGAGRLMERHSPLGVTGLSMAIGSALYVPVMWPPIAAVEWSVLNATTWIKIVYSAVFALCVAYMIWYAAVQRIGSARTSVYSNIIPIVALVVASVWLGEPLGVVKIVGAALVLAGVALMRVGPRWIVPRAA